MNVLLISNGFQPNYEKAFANGLSENGLSVVLIASDRTLSSQLSPRVKLVNLRGSQDPRRSALRKAANMVRYGVALAAHLLKHDYQVVHMTGLFMTASPVAGCLECLAYRLVVRRLFMTVHNVLPHGRHTGWHKAIYRFIYAVPHMLVVHTEKMRAALVKEFHVSPNRVIVMAHGVDTVPAELRAPEYAEKLRLLSFGALHRYKGVDILLAAMRLCPDIPLEVVIVGEARDPAYAREIELSIAALSESHRVVWRREFIAEDEVQPYFEAADAAVLPYRHIDQSGVLFTAFRFGVPVIVTDVGSFRESVPEFAGIVAAEARPAAVAEALRAFWLRRTEFDRKQIRALAQSLAWSETVKPLLQAYRACGS